MNCTLRNNEGSNRIVTNARNILLPFGVFSKRNEQSNNKNNENEISILKISKVVNTEYVPFLNISYILLTSGRTDSGKAISTMNARFGFPKIGFLLLARKNMIKILLNLPKQ